MARSGSPPPSVRTIGAIRSVGIAVGMAAAVILSCQRVAASELCVDEAEAEACCANRQQLIASSPGAQRENLRLGVRSGLLWFSDVRLESVIAEFNRLSRQKIVIADTAAAKRRVGGQIKVNNASMFIARLRSIGVAAELAETATVECPQIESQSSPSMRQAREDGAIDAR